MKKNKKFLFIIIFIFVAIFFTLNFLDEIFWTGFDKREKNEDFSYEDNSNKNKKDESSDLEAIPDIDIEKDMTVTISVTGDVMVHMPQVRSAFDSSSNSYDFTSVFEEIKPYISSSDISIANLETVIAGNEYGFSGFPRFNSPEELLKALNDTGFDILSTANNHSIDKGKKGIINTIDNIEKYNMVSVGTYKESTDRVLIKEINGIKLGILAYTYGCNGLEVLLTEEELDYMVNIIDEERIRNDIKLTEDMGVDMTIVLMHWGNEYQLEPSEEQILLGSNMITWGADIILGSHPHVIQRSEIIEHNGERKFIIYSMGNFISNQRRETMKNSRRKYTEDGIIVTLTLEKDSSMGRTSIKDVDYIPTWVYRYSENGKLMYKIMPTIDYMDNSNDNIQILDESVLNKIKESYTQTMKRMSR